MGIHAPIGSIRRPRYGAMHLNGNTDETSITNVDQFVKANGTFTVDGLSGFDFVNDDTLVYTGKNGRFYWLFYEASLLAGSNMTLRARLWHNGSLFDASDSEATTGPGSSRIQNLVGAVTAKLHKGDQIQLWVANRSSTDDITVEGAHVTVHSFDPW